MLVVLAIVGLVLVLGLGAWGVVRRSRDARRRAALDAVQSPPATLRREDLAPRLRAIAESAPPEVHPGAMCYAPRRFPQHVEYVCLVCGARTVYALHPGDWIELELPLCRKAFAEITGMRARLDETPLCSSCTPGKREPSVAVELQLAGETEWRRLEGLQADDLRLLAEFGADHRVHRGDHDFEVPLRDRLARLEELLGVKRPG